MNSFHIIQFLLSKNSAALKDFWKAEITPRGKLNLFRLSIAHRCRKRHFMMWWRLASEMHMKGNKQQRHIAKKINWALQDRYACEVGLSAMIGKNPKFYHLTGIVISAGVKIGNNAVIHQNVTIGVKSDADHSIANIGDSVNIGAGTCILGGVTIGDNVKIGAMSMVLSDIPDNSTYICVQFPRIIPN